MKRRERKLHLRLNPDRPQNTQIRRRGDRVVEQRRLPAPGSPRTTRTPLRPARPVEQRVEHHALVSPAPQHHHAGAESPPAMGTAIVDPIAPGVIAESWRAALVPARVRALALLGLTERLLLQH
jgi:hypothetical protein